MKVKLFPKVFILFLILSLFLSTNVSLAQEKKQATLESDEGLEDKIEKIEKLKEKIATRVAELRDQDKAAVYGTVKELTDKTIILASRKGERKVVFSDDSIFFTLTDEVKKETETNKVDKDDLLSVFGYLDQDSNTISAKYIYIQELPVRLIGKIADIDTSNYTITVASKQEEIIVDYEKNTKSYNFDKNSKKWVISGFSKLNLGNKVHIFGSAHKSEDNRIYANRIYTIVFPEQLSPTEKKETPPPQTPEDKENTIE